MLSLNHARRPFVHFLIQLSVRGSLCPESGGHTHITTLVTRDTVDQTFAANRQLFLTEQGYRYTITDHV
jgi:hypothetical protein